MATVLEELAGKYRALGIDRQLDYDKFYIYSILPPYILGLMATAG